MAIEEAGSSLDLKKCGEAFEVCACSNLRKASRAVTQLFDEALQPSGLRSTQMVILVAIASNNSVSISFLARELVMDASTLNRNLQLLARRQLVQLQPGTDGRRKTMALTSAGAAALESALPLWEEAQFRFHKNFGMQGWRDVLSNMDRMVTLSRTA